jgi:hypothetical protein
MKAKHFPAIFIVIVSVVFLTQGALFAKDDVRIVRLMKNPDTSATATQLAHLIDPEILLINQGTIVVWANSGLFQVGVSFEEGKTCQVATKAAEGFQLDKASACYTTVILPNGGTRSLKFLEKGTYEYKVTWGDLPKESRGKIIVY